MAMYMYEEKVPIFTDPIVLQVSLLVLGDEPYPDDCGI